MDTDDVPKVPMAFTMSMVGASFAFSVVVYLLVAHLIGQQRALQPFPSKPPEFLYNPGIAVVAVLALAAGLGLERFLLAPHRVEKAAEQGEMTVRARFQAALSVQMGAFEVVAVVGLVYFFLGGTFAHLIRYCIVTWVLMGIALLKIPSYVARAQRALGSASEPDYLKQD